MIPRRADPDPLFDALRDRLGAHERAPAADTWAALAGQLAAAKQRKRRRRAGWAFGSLLLLLLIGWSVFWRESGERMQNPRLAQPSPASSPASPAGVKSRPALHGSGPALHGSGPALLGSGPALSGTGPALSGTGPALSGTGPALSGSGPALSGSGPALSGSGPALSGSSPALHGSAVSLDSVESVADSAILSSSRVASTRKRARVLWTPMTQVATPPAVAVTASGKSEAFGMALLPLRSVAVQLDSLQQPEYRTPTFVADTTHPLPPVVMPRWSLALSVGLDLTHRRLTSAGATPLQRIERPNGAGQAAVSVGYASAGGRWRWSAGVGYAAYRQAIRARLTRSGTTLAYVEQTVMGADGQPIRTLSWQWVPTDSVMGRQRVRATPVAHYLTVPLLTEWLPRRATAGAGSRWQPVLMAGLTPHILLNARQATLTQACDCETAPADLQRFALGVTAGAGIEYALRPDWWLSIRPAATYVLTNAAAAGQPARHPWRIGVTVGLRRNQAPKRAAQ